MAGAGRGVLLSVRSRIVDIGATVQRSIQLEIVGGTCRSREIGHDRFGRIMLQRRA